MSSRHFSQFKQNTKLSRIKIINSNIQDTSQIIKDLCLYIPLTSSLRISSLSLNLYDGIDIGILSYMLSVPVVQSYLIEITIYAGDLSDLINALNALWLCTNLTTIYAQYEKDDIYDEGISIRSWRNYVYQRIGVIPCFNIVHW